MFEIQTFPINRLQILNANIDQDDIGKVQSNDNNNNNHEKN